MNRAQEIRNKRLAERKAEEDKRKKEELKIETESQKMFDWVLDLLEKPTKYNTKDEVILSDTYYHNVQIGISLEDGITEKVFDEDVMEKLAKMFNEEEGYNGEYVKGEYPVSESKVIVRIK